MDTLTAVSSLSPCVEGRLVDVPRLVRGLDGFFVLPAIEVLVLMDEKVCWFDVVCWVVTPLLVSWLVTRLLVCWVVIPLLVCWEVTPLLVCWEVAPLLVCWEVTPLLVCWEVTPLLVCWEVTPLLVCRVVTLLVDCWVVTPLLVSLVVVALPAEVSFTVVSLVVTSSIVDCLLDFGGVDADCIPVIVVDRGNKFLETLMAVSILTSSGVVVIAFVMEYEAVVLLPG